MRDLYKQVDCQSLSLPCLSSQSLMSSCLPLANPSISCGLLPSPSVPLPPGAPLPSS